MSMQYSHEKSRRMHPLWIALLSFLVLGITLPCPTTSMAAPAGRILIAGYGPELPIIQDLARAYEKRHPGSAIDIEWDKTVRAVEMINQGMAQIAVTDQPAAALHATTIAWDGIAVIVNFANPIRDMTSRQVKALFTGQITRWSDLDGADSKVDVISRISTDNVTAGFESSLEFKGRPLLSGQLVRSDQKALSVVSGQDNAVSYMSLSAAMKAQEDGIPIQILTIDKVEPGEPTVRNGRYKPRRPILLLTPIQASPFVESFIAFTQSPEGHQLIRPFYVPADPPISVVSPRETPLPAKMSPAS